MNTTDETRTSINAGEPQATEQKGNKKSAWREVIIGGVPGIILGAAGTLGIDSAIAASKTDAEEESEADIPEIGENVNVAENVNDDMTFDEAFAAARKEVGAGGAFVWKGDVYGTYLKSEWDAMSDDQKEDYTNAVRGTDIEAEDEETAVPENAVEAEAPKDEANAEDAEASEEPEITVLASEDTEVGYTEVYDTTGNGMPDTALIDTDEDGEADVLMADTTGDGHADTLIADVNGDGVIDESEVFQVTEDGIVGMDEVDGCAPDDLSDQTLSI